MNNAGVKAGKRPGKKFSFCGTPCPEKPRRRKKIAVSLQCR